MIGHFEGIGFLARQFFVEYLILDTRIVMPTVATQNDLLAVPEEEIAVLQARGLSSGSAEIAEEFSIRLIEIRPVLWSYLRTMLRDHGAIEDCIQEASITIWEHFLPEWNREDLRRYAFTCARFKALSWLKKNKPKSVVFLNAELAEQIGERIMNATVEGTETSNEDRLLALDQCIDSLPESQQRLIRARYSNNSSMELTAYANDRSRSMSSVYKQLERLRSALKRCTEGKVDQANS